MRYAFLVPFIYGLLGAWPGSYLAYAAQTLIPAPYPENSGSTAQIGGTAGGAIPPSEHQNLIAHPMPQNLGPDAAGDFHPLRTHHHQHLVKLPYWRQYHPYH